MKQISRVGVDIAKSVFQVHAVDRHDQIKWQAKLKREKWLEQLCQHVPKGALVVMEACSGAHHWARELQCLGFQVKLIAAQFVKPYVKGHKNDQLDAQAICEAAGRPSMRFVSIKSVSQQDLQAQHRVRQQLITGRTQKANQIRGLVAEYGIVAPKSLEALRRSLPDWLECADNGLSDAFRLLLSDLQCDLQRLDTRVAELDAAIGNDVQSDELSSRLQSLRGVGPLIASALSIELREAENFKTGRDFAASLGLVPHQHSSGGKTQLLGITKRGNGYLRSLLIHGARAVLRHVQNRDDPLSRWLQKLLKSKHMNTVAVALANKTARIAWALATKGGGYDESRAACNA